MRRLDREVERLLSKEKEARDVMQCEASSSTTMTDGAGVEWCRDRKTGRWWWRDHYGTWQSRGFRYTPHREVEVYRRPSDVSDIQSEAPTERSMISSASTTATLSMDEEIEARKWERELRNIASLQQRKAKGEALTKYEESAIRRKPEFDLAQVMVKVHAGAVRPLLGSEVAPACVPAQEEDDGDEDGDEDIDDEKTPASPLPLPLPLPARLVQSEPLVPPVGALVANQAWLSLLD